MMKPKLLQSLSLDINMTKINTFQCSNPSYAPTSWILLFVAHMVVTEVINIFSTTKVRNGMNIVSTNFS